MFFESTIENLFLKDFEILFFWQTCLAFTGQDKISIPKPSKPKLNSKQHKSPFEIKWAFVKNLILPDLRNRISSSIAIN
jgi:hypothetical protein